MAKGVDRHPRSTWGLPYLTGKKETISVLRIQNDLKKTHCAVGVQNQKVCATTGVVGSGPIFKTHLVSVRRKNPFKNDTTDQYMQDHVATTH
ncbi:hypothetical protein EVAR_65540_1 [Eumeta japonica]|uniref:Uncharacterized protein n=1 Tax=Eumeta variegata TaxID=151549 RepID=A0A4C1ZLP6_EUMVA|nr:hypothetical protein EVAR_65540_1 [Eumeta japonica]